MATQIKMRGSWTIWNLNAIMINYVLSDNIDKRSKNNILLSNNQGDGNWKKSNQQRYAVDTQGGTIEIWRVHFSTYYLFANRKNTCVRDGSSVKVSNVFGSGDR